MTRAWNIPIMWEGATVAILAAGPEMNQELADSLRAHKTIAVNRAVRFAPWADLFIALDPGHHEGMADFKGMRVCGAECDADAFYGGMMYENVNLGPHEVIQIRNNLLAAVRIAERAGAARVILAGVDTERYEQIHNFRGLTAGLSAMIHELRSKGVVVEGGPKSALVVHAMTGLGDNLHARAVVRELSKYHEIWIRTRWPRVYHDMPELHLSGEPLPGTIEMSLGYHPTDVQTSGSVLGAMSKAANVPVGDFRLPVPFPWAEKAAKLIKDLKADKPLMIYRPIVEVAATSDDSARAKLARNPDPEWYVMLAKAARRDYFVLSLANLQPGVEWLAGPQLEADMECHAGELDFETLVGMFGIAKLVFCHPGFAAVLSQAVGTPSICVFGGYEDRRSFSAGADYAPWLPIEPKTPCPCWSADCAGDKTIDIPAAMKRIDKFLDALER
jgi:hypothetical protein